MGMYIFFLVRKENIRQELSQEIGNSIAGQFLIRDIGINFFNLFPNVSISLKGVDMRDSAWQVHHESFLKAEKVLLKINPFFRSEERRVGKECRSRWSPYH